MTLCRSVKLDTKQFLTICVLIWAGPNLSGVHIWQCSLLRFNHYGFRFNHNDIRHSLQCIPREPGPVKTNQQGAFYKINVTHPPQWINSISLLLASHGFTPNVLRLKLKCLQTRDKLVTILKSIKLIIILLLKTF